MKAFFFLGLASILLTASTANHVPGHVKHHSAPTKVAEDENRVLMSSQDEQGLAMGGATGDDIGNGGVGGMYTGGDLGLGGQPNGMAGQLGGGGLSGYRALRDVGDDEAADMNGDAEYVVAGGTVARGGVVATRPRYGPYYRRPY